MIGLDLHIHSHASFDSLSHPEDILRTAKRRGLNGIAITDHNTIQGGLETQAINQDPNFLVIVGAEICTDIGDIVGLFLTEEIKSRQVQDVIEEIHQQDGLAVLPHPYKGHTNYAFEKLNVDAVEIYNARTSEAQNAAALMLAQCRQLPTVSGSDAHFTREIGRAVTWFDFSPSHLGQMNRQNLLHHIISRPTAVEYTPRYIQYSSQVIKHYKQRHFISCGKSLLMVFLTWVYHLQSQGSKASP